MPLYGISITKKVVFRGADQEFSNVYHYDSNTIMGIADADEAINDLKAIEAGFHSTDVTFVLGRVWTAGGTPGANVMVTERALSGTGSTSPNTSMDRERAVLIQFAAGLNVKGRPVYLRKWYHSCGAFATVGFSAGNLQNTAAIDPTYRTSIATAANAIKQLTPGAHTLNLTAKSGRDPTGDATCHPWLEHHQLGDQWRSN